MHDKEYLEQELPPTSFFSGSKSPTELVTLSVRCADSDTQVDNVGIGCGSGFSMFEELDKKSSSCKTAQEVTRLK